MLNFVSVRTIKGSSSYIRCDRMGRGGEKGGPSMSGGVPEQGPAARRWWCRRRTRARRRRRTGWTLGNARYVHGVRGDRMCVFLSMCVCVCVSHTHTHSLSLSLFHSLSVSLFLSLSPAVVAHPLTMHRLAHTRLHPHPTSLQHSCNVQACRAS